MSDITKLVSMGIPPSERKQEFNQGDASQGDVLLVNASLGKPAGQIVICPTAAMTVRVNVYHIGAPTRTGNDLMFTSQLKNLALSVTVKDESAAPLTIAAGTTLVLDGPIKDIELVSTSGNWTIKAE